MILNLKEAIILLLSFIHDGNMIIYITVISVVIMTIILSVMMIMTKMQKKRGEEEEEGGGRVHKCSVCLHRSSHSRPHQKQ